MEASISFLAPKLQVIDAFPSYHIEGIAFGEVGVVYLTLSPLGVIEKAEADLYDAPFKRMLIDDPDTLRIFNRDTLEINMSALQHPWPMFVLKPIVPLEDENGEVPDNAWDIGRLVDITNKPTAARWALNDEAIYGDGTQEGAVHKSIRLRVEAEEAKARARAQARKARIDSITSHSSTSSKHRPTSTSTNNQPKRRTLSSTTNPHLEDAAAETRPRRSSRPTREAATTISNYRDLLTDQPETPKPHASSKAQRLADAYQAVTSDFSDADQASYHHFVFVVRKEVARDEDAKKQFHRELEEFVRRNGVVERHDKYVRLQRSSGANALYQLPFLGE